MNNGTSLPALGAIAEALPAPLVPNTSLIAAELVQFAQQAEIAEGNATRAVIDSDDAAGRAADVLRSINAALKLVDAKRKEKTAPYDADKAVLMGLYGAPAKRLEGAKTLLSNKLTGYQRQKEAAAFEAARVARQAAEEEARRLAAAQAALGDEEGAEQIMEDLADLPMPDTKAVAVGTYGASSSLRRRPVGQIVDMRNFLAWALSSAPTIISAVEIGQRVLNDLAGEALESKRSIPGFVAEYDVKSTVR